MFHVWQLLRFFFAYELCALFIARLKVGAEGKEMHFFRVHLLTQFMSIAIDFSCHTLFFS